MYIVNSTNYVAVYTGEVDFLISYGVVVCSWHWNNRGTKKPVFQRHWDGWSRTTQRHVGDFLISLGSRRSFASKDNWYSMPVLPATITLLTV